jgi:hypothetical protein
LAISAHRDPHRNLPLHGRWDVYPPISERTRFSLRGTRENWPARRKSVR